MTNPDPAELLMGLVEVQIGRDYPADANYRAFRTKIPVKWAGEVYAAAAARDMSVSAYLRRSMLAFVAFDRSLDLTELLADEPPTRIRFAQPGNDRRENGTGHGRWEIGGLV